MINAPNIKPLLSLRRETAGQEKEMEKVVIIMVPNPIYSVDERERGWIEEGSLVP